VGVLVWGPLGGGLLGGKFRSSDVDLKEVVEWREPPVDSGARLASVLRVLEEVATRNDCELADVVLAWTLSNPIVSSVLVGGRTPEQLAANLREPDITAADLALIEEQTRPPLIYPYWHQAITSGPRMSPADRVLHGTRLGQS
jgi:aryl-alcohol dehydrogenase-like predicted oxidoreductase